MIERIIEWSDRNRILVGIAVLGITVWGWIAANNISLDAIPDLSDTQVIVFSEWKGRSPDLVEDQVTYPIVSALIAAPQVKTVRGISFFGLSFVYALFEDGTDIYWARSRVLEYMSKVQGQLPSGVIPTLGPDATGVGWGFQYALVDTSGKNSLQEIRSFQDWYLRYWLESVPGVPEVASVGGYVKQYQVNLDPAKLLAHNIPLHHVVAALKQSNNDVGGRILEMSGREYMIRGRGYVTSTTDLEAAVVRIEDGVPVTVGDLGDVVLGPEMRRGAADWNGQGDVVGGIVVVRFGENVLDVIQRVKARINEVRDSLPEGVELKVAYDGSELILESVATLKEKLLEELIIVALICALFLWHLPSALAAVITLPIAVLLSIITMYQLGFSSNIMSLGGIAIAIGAMVDAAIVMVENAHKWRENNPDMPQRKAVIEAAKEVGRPLFFSLIVITVSFLPVFALQGQAGRLFTPLAYTKTFAMGWAAILAITVVPPVLVLLIRGKIKPQSDIPINRVLVRGYRPTLDLALRHRRTTAALAVAGILATLPLYNSLGSEFMPPLNEGSILYMPTTLPGVSITEAQQLMHTQDKLIKQLPEVESVFGKVGRANTPTDPAPLSMWETTIVLKPKSEWRPGITWDDIIRELDTKLKFPGVTNAWTMPIKGRIDMLTTGIRTPVGIKILGTDLKVIEDIGKQLESILDPVAGTRSVYAERVVGGTFLDITVDRQQAARYGLNVEQVEMIIETAIGGMNIDTTVEGPERYPVNVRYNRDNRSDLSSLERVLVPTPTGAQVPLGMLAEIKIVDGSPAIRNENGSKTGWVFVDVDGRDIGSYVEEAKRIVADAVELPPGYALAWSGQYEYMQAANERLSILIPFTLLLVFLLLYFNFKNVPRVLLICLSLPFSTLGSLIYLRLADYDLSVAVAVGIIAMAGVAAETGVIMVHYLDQAVSERLKKLNLQTLSPTQLTEAVKEGAQLRLRPVLMTDISTIVGLLPILWSTGTGADVMERIAAPMVGGLVTTQFLTLLVVPIIYIFLKTYEFNSQRQTKES